MASNSYCNIGKMKSFLPLCILLILFLHGSLYAADINTVRQLYNTGQYEKCAEAANEGPLGTIGEERGLLLVKSLMARGKYHEASIEAEMALLSQPRSLRLLMIGYKSYLYNNKYTDASEKLSRIYRYASTYDISSWSAGDLVALGEAMLLQGSEPRIVLGELYNRALSLDEDCRDAYLASGQLALDKQDYELASEQYRKGIEKFGDDPDMYYGLALAFYNSDRQKMIEALDKALSLNPNHAPSLLLMAEHQLDCENNNGAENYLEQISKVNFWNPEVWAFRSVLAYLKNDITALQQAHTNALKYYSKNPKVDHIIGKKLSMKYHFKDSAQYQLQALALDGDYEPAKLQLAQDFLRLGREEEGWELAEEVYNADKYNVMAYNLVSLSDHLATFTTIESGNFIVRMDPREAIEYGDEVIDLLKRAERELTRKYGAELENKIIIEYFPDQQDFAVRTFGEPGGDGFLGVCFGNVITANSPKPEIPANWQSTLWHEFTHVVTLNITNNKMPRWLSTYMGSENDSYVS